MICDLHPWLVSLPVHMIEGLRQYGLVKTPTTDAKLQICHWIGNKYLIKLIIKEFVSNLVVEIIFDINNLSHEYTRVSR